MKHLFLALLFCAGSTAALAQAEQQDDRQGIDQDKIQQEPQRPAQLDVERNARIEAQRLYNEKTAKRKAKNKAKKLSKILDDSNSKQSSSIETPYL